MPDDEPYATESMFRFLVDKEKSGFDQCRNKLMGYIDRRLEELGREYIYGWDDYAEGKESSYKDILEYLKGTDRDTDAGAELPA